MDKSTTKPLTTKGKFDNLDIRVGRVIDVSAPIDIADNSGVVRPHRVLRLDFGELGIRTSVGQFALVGHEHLMRRLVLAVCNLPPRKMGEYVSEVLTLGTRHPESPPNQSQAVPIYTHELAAANDVVF